MAVDATGASDACDPCMADPEPADCMVTCYEDAGFSQACSECAGEFVGCIATHCSNACMAGAQGDACGECVLFTCGEQFEACWEGI